MELQTYYDNIQNAFNQSDIKLINKDWHYSLCNSVPKIGQPLIVGFNWEVDSNHKKTTISDLNTEIDWNELATLKKIKSYLEKTFTKYPIKNYNQTNYCFFRSKKENQISQKDIELCEPIFFDFISKIKPKYIVSFSAKLRETFIEKGYLKYYSKKIVFDGKKNIYAYHGFVKIDNWWTYIYFLPHPSYWDRINNQETSLKELWKICWNTFPYEIWLTEFLNYLENIGEHPVLSKNPLNEKNIRKEIFTHNQEFINISNISFFKNHNKELQLIKSFDINDMTAVLKCFNPEFDSDKFKNYLTDKNNGLSMNDIIERNFDKETFDWSYNIVKMGLQTLYIYSKYFDERVDYLKLNK